MFARVWVCGCVQQAVELVFTGCEGGMGFSVCIILQLSNTDAIIGNDAARAARTLRIAKTGNFQVRVDLCACVFAVSRTLAGGAGSALALAGCDGLMFSDVLGI